ncbi:MAG: orotate phosphoribosyltransferase [Chloroflexota bacterium]
MLHILRIKGSDMIGDPLLGASIRREGHFPFESGYHSDEWLDLELLCLRPKEMEGPVAELANQLRASEVEAVCGPLNEGAFVALMVAAWLDVEFYYAERFDLDSSDELYPVKYRLPAVLRPRIHGKRVAIVNDVISAGSAVSGTYADLVACGAQPVAIAALLVLGDWTARFAEEKDIPFMCISQRSNRVWIPSECPLCAAGIPLEVRGDVTAPAPRDPHAPI